MRPASPTSRVGRKPRRKRSSRPHGSATPEMTCDCEGYSGHRSSSESCVLNPSYRKTPYQGSPSGEDEGPTRYVRLARFGSAGPI